jgi:hypothetical protein
MAKALSAAAKPMPVTPELIDRRIYLIRGRKVMLSPDLAELYQVEPRSLIQACKRNAERFPKDFMFQLNRKEEGNLKSQIVISSWGGARRAPRYAFTELGVAMLSSVLSSKRAVQMNIVVMRAFVRLREVVASQKELAHKIGEIEVQQRQHTSIITAVVDEIKKLKRAPPVPPQRRIGFVAEV